MVAEKTALPVALPSWADSGGFWRSRAVETPMNSRFLACLAGLFRSGGQPTVVYILVSKVMECDREFVTDAASAAIIVAVAGADWAFATFIRPRDT
jgi:hypothetical protein